MKYVTTIERRAIEQGSLQTRREIVIEALQLRFQSIPEELLAALSSLTDLQRLKQLHRQAIIAGSLEEFEHQIEAGDQD